MVNPPLYRPVVTDAVRVVWPGEPGPHATNGRDRAFRQFRVGRLTPYSVWAVSFPRPATKEAGGDSAPAAAASQPFGPNSAEVSAFIDALGKLSAAQWRKAVAARRAAGSLIRDPTVLPAEAVRAMLRGEANGGIGPALAGILEPRSDEEVVTAWQAVSALARRRQLSPLTFAAHYVPFASLIPPAAADRPVPSVELFTKSLRWLGESQWLALARPWTVDREAAAALLQAAIKSLARLAGGARAILDEHEAQMSRFFVQMRTILGILQTQEDDLTGLLKYAPYHNRNTQMVEYLQFNQVLQQFVMCGMNEDQSDPSRTCLPSQ